MINKRELEALEKYLQENIEDNPRIARSFLEDAVPVLKMRTARIFKNFVLVLRLQKGGTVLI